MPNMTSMQRMDAAMQKHDGLAWAANDGLRGSQAAPHAITSQRASSARGTTDGVWAPTVDR